MTRTTSRPNQLEAEYLERKAQIRADGNLGWEEKESSIKALRGRISPSTGKEAPGEYSGRSVQHPNQRQVGFSGGTRLLLAPERL